MDRCGPTACCRRRRPCCPGTPAAAISSRRWSVAAADTTQDRARSRFLNDDELRAVWLAAEQDKGAFGAFIKFTLLTATRRGESAALRRSELSDGGATWIIPGAKYKNGKDHLIPLSPAARAIVAAMPVLAGGDHVFSATGTNPLGAWAKRKKAFDKACGVSGWRLHDLRRTARTLLSARRHLCRPCRDVSRSRLGWRPRRPTTGTNIETKSVMPSRRWPR